MGCSRILTLSLIVVLGLKHGVVSAEPLRVVTSDFPPYSMLEHGSVSGLSTNVVREVLERAGVETRDVEVYPWARAFTMARKLDSILIYSIAMSDERQPLFQWVGPIAPYNVDLYKLRSREDIQVKTLDDAKAYRVGGEFQDIKQAFLLERGFEIGRNLDLAPRAEINVRKLFAGRIDLLPMSEYNLPYLLREEGFDPAQVEKVMNLEGVSYYLYLAFSLDVPEATVARARQALNALREEGRLQTLWVEALHQPPSP
ncbi:substrate-binding periplasmic protein [Marinobacter caseinilyticus]|uniref:substrate-binding periplasmic protein n=1 Tax=Marinobacter caseinilyticus TaxID=2692195 RepID=UPI001409F092|nr:transporter substrate-binding domain-containing protein [Marinobacter caseinilyticus]